jgi:hypothetical protein
MKKLLLTSLLLTGCPLPESPNRPPTPVPTATPTIGTPPTIFVSSTNRCAPQAPLKSCKSASFGDGKGGTLFKRSDTNPKNFAFLLPGNIRTFESVEVCSVKKCEKLLFAGCANPSGDMLRAHYKGSLSLNAKAKWTVKFGECKLEIKDNERTD